MSPRLRIAGLVSITLHLAIAAGFLLFNRRSAPLTEAPDKPALVELVMEEQKGSGQTTVTPSTPPPAEPRPQTLPPPAPKPPEKAEPAPAPAETPPPSPPAPPAKPTPPAPPAKPAETAQPAPPKQVPQINIGGTDSESNAIVLGPDVIPASPDNKARNRPPIYPEDAARLGQQGAVLVVVHVGPSGLPAGVEVERSSGYASLDKAAENAVRKWTFQPATKDGLPVPYDFRMNFTFAFQ
jgi:protein TonB